MAQNKDSEKAQAYELFMKTTMPMEKIGEALNIHPSTLSRWRNDENWDTIKQAEQNTLQSTIANLKETIHLKSAESVELARKGESTSHLTDEISKLNSTLRDYTGIMPLSDYISVLNEFINFTPKEDINAYLGRQENKGIKTLRQLMSAIQMAFVKKLAK
jgi:transposase-like protein